MYRGNSGNMKIFRALACGAQIACGVCVAMNMTENMVLAVIMSIILSVFGMVSAWLIHDIAFRTHLRGKVPVLIGLICMMIWMLLGLLCGQVWIPLGCVLGQWACGYLAAYGGRRSELGRHDAGQVLGLRRYLKKLPREDIGEIAVVQPHQKPAEVRYLQEEMDVTQGKLGMGFTCGSEDTPALLMGNTLFGGSSNSKLFMNVREKLSLCYFASSLYHRQKGMITVSSGIEFDKYQQAYDEILRQLEAVQNGDLEDWELEGAKSVLLNAYASMSDSQGKLENFYLGQAATGQEETPEILARQVREVTAERIFDAMKTVTLDTVYFLKGKEAEEA